MLGSNGSGNTECGVDSLSASASGRSRSPSPDPSQPRVRVRSNSHRHRIRVARRPGININPSAAVFVPRRNRAPTINKRKETLDSSSVVEETKQISTETETAVASVPMEETKKESYAEKMERWLEMGVDEFCYTGGAPDEGLAPQPSLPKVRNNFQASTWPQAPPKVSPHGYTQNGSTKN